MEWSDREIEESRRRHGVPDDWYWALCEAGCGDIVWHPGREKLIERAGREQIVLVCSAACSTAWMKKQVAR